MTPQEQQLAIARAQGLTLVQSPHHSVWGHTTDGKSYLPLPDYLKDLNAMHEAEKVLTLDQQGRFVCELDRLLHGGRASDLQEGFLSLHATASQRAEAFLRTIGKWAEDS